MSIALIQIIWLSSNSGSKQIQTTHMVQSTSGGHTHLSNAQVWHFCAFYKLCCLQPFSPRRICSSRDIWLKSSCWGGHCSARESVCRRRCPSGICQWRSSPLAKRIHSVPNRHLRFRRWPGTCLHWTPDWKYNPVASTDLQRRALHSIQVSVCFLCINLDPEFRFYLKCACFLCILLWIED